MATCTVPVCEPGGFIDPTDLKDLFLADLKSSLRELEVYSDRGDHLRVASIAHRLRSRSRTLVSTRLGDVADHLEQAARSGDRGRVRGMVSEFHFACSQFDSSCTVL